MTLHIFNPEHDIALASGLSNFTAPHAGRQLRHDLGFLPALWATEDDAVLVDDPDYALHQLKKVRPRLAPLTARPLNFRDEQFLSAQQPAPANFTTVSPWGWNSALRAMLLRRGVDAAVMPNEEQLQTIRQLSHRHTAACLLPNLRLEGTVGESFECRTQQEVAEHVSRFGRAVLKAPWSSSGRGLRFADTSEYTVDNKHIAGWLSNLLTSQGSVMVEPYYNKVKDFGMEFESDGNGQVSYQGLSLFQTKNGAYTGNIIATEAAKEQLIGHYIPLTLLQNVRQLICSHLGLLLKGKYQGPFGVDMMAVAADEGYLLHPCVEINLRRTMGHVALLLSPDDDDVLRVMRIMYSDYKYHLQFSRL